MKCPKCSSQFSSHDTNCPVCGEPAANALLLNPTCPNCGTPTMPNSSICSGCGKRLGVAGLTPLQIANRAASMIALVLLGGAAAVMGTCFLAATLSSATEQMVYLYAGLCGLIILLLMAWVFVAWRKK